MNWNLRRKIDPDVSMIPPEALAKHREERQRILDMPVEKKEAPAGLDSFASIWSILPKKAPLYPTDGVILHAGAYRGEETTTLARTYLRPVYAFEPDPRNLPFLRDRAYECNQIFRTDIRVHAKAVGAKTEKKEMYFSDSEAGFSQSNTLKYPTLHRQISPEMNWDRTAEVDVVALDDFLGQIGDPVVHMLFADVEGAEDLMLQGMQRGLRRTRFVFTEFSLVERYQGAPGLQEVQKSLPGRWEVLHVFPHDQNFGDVLLKNLECRA